VNSKWFDRLEEPGQQLRVADRLLREGRLADSHGPPGFIVAVNAGREIVGHRLLGDACLGMRGHVHFDALDRGTIKEREGAQVLADVAVVGVEPSTGRTRTAGLLAVGATRSFRRRSCRNFDPPSLVRSG